LIIFFFNLIFYIKISEIRATKFELDKIEVEKSVKDEESSIA